MRFLQNFWVGFCLNDHVSSCIASHLRVHNVSCILDVCSICRNDLEVEKLMSLRFRERERDEFRKVRRQVLSREIGEK